MIYINRKRVIAFGSGNTAGLHRCAASRTFEIVKIRHMTVSRESKLDHLEMSRPTSRLHGRVREPSQKSLQLDGGVSSRGGHIENLK